MKSAAAYCTNVLVPIALLVAWTFVTVSAQASTEEPIAFVGHGAMFGPSGDEIEPTMEFLRRAQAWYRDRLLQTATATDRRAFLNFERQNSRLFSRVRGVALLGNGQALLKLAGVQRLRDRDRMMGKLRALYRATKTLVAAEALPMKLSPFDRLRRSPRLRRSLQLLTERIGGRTALDGSFLTDLKGEEYRKYCVDHGVPIPPEFGPGSAWTARSTVDAPDGVVKGEELYIVRAFSAQVLTYLSASPAGMCVALPRFDTNDIVQADGIICFGQKDPLDPGNAKSCYWDNQDPKEPFDETAEQPPPDKDGVFTFPRSAPPPISTFAGGADLRGGVGGVCSDCHSGDNPYIIHGHVLESLSSATATQPALPTFAETWHKPLVRTGDAIPWPENPGPAAVVPQRCASCHSAPSLGGEGGRLPMLSSDLRGHCGAVLRPALGALGPPAPGKRMPPPASMPPSSPGSLACTPNIPNNDPRYRACTVRHTVDCTPQYEPADTERYGNPLYALKCTTEIAEMLKACTPP